MRLELKLEKLNKTPRFNLSMQTQCYVLLLLPTIGFLVFTIYPIMWAMVKAWYYYDGVAASTKYVGFENFIKVFKQDWYYWRSWATTIKYMIYKLPVEIMLSLVLAVLLSRKLKGSGFFRSMYFLPNIISVAIVGLVFSNLFDYFGVVNAWLVKLNIIEQEIEWFSYTNRAMFVLVIGSIWNCFGINTLYFCAALTNVPEELYESAELDGAGAIQKFFWITIPMIAPVLQVILLLAINGTIHVGEYVLVMTNGIPAGTTLTVGAYLIKTFVPGFAAGRVNIGYGCAISIITSFIYAGIAFVYLKTSKKMSTVY